MEEKKQDSNKEVKEQLTIKEYVESLFKSDEELSTYQAKALHKTIVKRNGKIKKLDVVILALISIILAYVYYLNFLPAMPLVFISKFATIAVLFVSYMYFSDFRIGDWVPFVLMTLLLIFNLYLHYNHVENTTSNILVTAYALTGIGFYVAQFSKSMNLYPLALIASSVGQILGFFYIISQMFTIY